MLGTASLVVAAVLSCLGGVAAVLTVSAAADAATCSFSESASGPITVSNGTGLYKGITGTLEVTEYFALIGPRLTSGPKKGQCNESNNAQPVASFTSVVGSGTVHFT